MRKKNPLTKGSAPLCQNRGCLKIFNTFWSLILLLVIFFAGCKKDDFKGEVTGLCPVVTTDPMDKAVDVVLNKVITATFNTDMDSSTISKTTYIISQGGAQVAGKVATTASFKAFTFTPDLPLLPFTTYTGTVTTGAADRFHTALVNDYIWTFTTLPQVTLSSNPAAGGTTVGAGEFAQGAVVTVTATPNTGYTFTNWTNNGTIVSTSSSYQFTMAGNKALVANFTVVSASQFAVVLSSSPAAGGTTTGSGPYNAGSSVTVTATPNNGYTFTNWTENGNVVSTSSSYQFSLAANRTLIANFKVIAASQFAVILSSNPAAGGTTNGSGPYNAASSVTVTATPNSGYNFVNWTENGTIVSTSPTYTFVLNANRTLVANFAINSYTLALSANPTAGGATSGAGSFNAGTPVTATATPNTGYTFVNWTDNGVVASTNATYTFTLNANRTLVANFSADTYTVALSSNPTAGGTTSGAGSFNAGTSVTVTATLNTGYTFVNWTENGAITSTNAAYTFPLNTNRTLVANFSANGFTLNVTAINGTVVKNPNQATYNSGSTVQLTATPNAGYTFTSWSVDATGSTNPLTVIMNTNKNITANFTLTPTSGPGQVNLRSAGNFGILTKAGISTTGITSVQGDIGVSPAAATAITGFGLIMDATGQFSTAPAITGKVYAADYAAPTPSKMTTAVSDMETAYTTANGLVTPAPIVDLYAGNISGKILTPGLYKYNTGVLITNAGVTLAGGPNDTWVFQISQDLTVNNGAIITLTGGAQAKNITWVVAGQATLGSNSNFSGIILSKTLISLNTGATVTGRLLAQTAVTLNASTVVLP
jgi:uncharacterized repeat protein (TIGR02543 family)